MGWLEDNMQWVLLAAGLLTFSMIQAVFMPRTVMRTYFGEADASPASMLLMRNWGALIAAGGLLLAWAAFHPETRVLAIIFTGASKLVFIALVLGAGGAFLKRQAGLAIAIDGVMLIVFAACVYTLLG